MRKSAFIDAQVVLAEGALAFYRAIGFEVSPLS
jgi:hypothetical protein